MELCFWSKHAQRLPYVRLSSGRKHCRELEWIPLRPKNHTNNKSIITAATIIPTARASVIFTYSLAVHRRSMRSVSSEFARAAPPTAPGERSANTTRVER